MSALEREPVSIREDECAYCHYQIKDMRGRVRVQLNNPQFTSHVTEYSFCDKLHAAMFLQFDDAFENMLRERDE